ncbi:TPA: phosphate propanoyltransferase, partial [Escherichia coli]|nr:phosphate propanoyltransferase [Escherichia coli]
TFDEVVIRVRNDFALELHIDTEEANAAGLKNGAQVTLIR